MHNSNAIYFRDTVYRLTNLNPLDYMSSKRDLENKRKREENEKKPLIIRVRDFIYLNRR